MNVEIPEFYFALRDDLKDEKCFMPTKAEPNASGWDVYAAMLDHKSLIIKPFEYVKIPLGFRVFCPDGWWLELRPRSSTFAKKYLHALYGVIDSSFEGELMMALTYQPEISINTELMCHNNYYDSYYETTDVYWTANTSLDNDNLTIQFGEAIGQIIPVRKKDMLTKKISNKDYNKMVKERGYQRGAQGFGSTSK